MNQDPDGRMDQVDDHLGTLMIEDISDEANEVDDVALH